MNKKPNVKKYILVYYSFFRFLFYAVSRSPEEPTLRFKPNGMQKEIIYL